MHLDRRETRIKVSDKIQQWASQLRTAEETKIPISPLRTSGLTEVSDAYKVQNLITRSRISDGARVVGKKIGLTSFAVQKQLGIAEPDYGALFHDREVLTGHSLSMSDLMQPKAETEIAFVLGEDVDIPEMSMVDFMSCIDYALVSIEIVGSRIENWDIRLVDTVADNASASHFVLGHVPRTLDEIDVIQGKMRMWKNGEVVSEGTGASCMGSPLNAALWLANKMTSLGEPLRAGELLLSGALGPMTPVVAGDEVSAEIDGLGTVSINFTE